MKRTRLKLRTFAALMVASFAAGAGFAIYQRHAEQRRTRVALPPQASSEPRKRVPYVVSETILDGKLAAGWQDWGWGKHEFQGGSPRIVFGSYGGIVFKHTDIASYFGALAFRFKAPESFGDFLEVAANYNTVGTDVLPRVPLESTMLANLGDGWLEAVVPWSLLNPTNSPIDRIVIRARRSVGQDWVLLDKVVLTKADGSAASPVPVRASKLSVDCSLPAVRINPLIYGVAHTTNGAGETAHRIGGNPMTRLNWDLGAWNSASDWYFENQPGEGPGGLWKWLDDNAKTGAKMAVVVPTIGWVAKDGTSVGFPAAKFGKQRAHDPSRPEAGDGFDPAGQAIQAGPPTQTSVAAPPEVIRRWVQKVRERDAARGSRSVDLYILDNEPDLWNSTHRDVHPEPVTYDELLDRTIRYATAIREADPDAVIAGPASWGWSGYQMSAKDAQAGWIFRPDRRAHGDRPLLAWYLEQLAAYEKKTGKRLLDVLDVHYYPQAEGVYGNSAKIDPATAALRLRSTRSLWDTTYRDESWIKEQIKLLPRLQDWVAQNYPGRGIALGEWSFGADTHVSGGLAIAEALGRFGQQGLTAAFYWSELQDKSPGYWGFRAFRNFDGQGGRFLDWSVPTRDSQDVSLFASRDDATSRLVLVVVNRDPTFATATHVELGSCGKAKDPRLFLYSGGPQGFVTSGAPSAAGSSLSFDVPPYSVGVVDLRLEPAAP